MTANGVAGLFMTQTMWWSLAVAKVAVEIVVVDGTPCRRRGTAQRLFASQPAQRLRIFMCALNDTFDEWLLNDIFMCFRLRHLPLFDECVFLSRLLIKPFLPNVAQEQCFVSNP